MNPDLDTLVTALYATIDDLLIENPHWVPQRPEVGITPKLSDAEPATIAVPQPLLGYNSEARFIRYAKTHLRPWFPYIPRRAGYNKRLRRSGQLLQHVIDHLARDCPSWWDNRRTHPDQASPYASSNGASPSPPSSGTTKTTQQPGPARSLTAYDH